MLSSMSDPAEKQVRCRYPEDLSPEEAAEMHQFVEVDVETYLRWLETGEGPEPCGPSSD